MKTKLFIGGKKVSKKVAESRIGEERLKRCISKAKEDFMEDPNLCLEYMISGAERLQIEFA